MRTLLKNQMVGALLALVVASMALPSLAFGAASAVNPKTSLLPSLWAAPCGRGFQGIVTDLVDKQAEAHGKAARNRVASKFLVLLHKEEEILLRHNRKPAARGVLEAIPADLIPGDARLASIAQRASEILQSRDEMLEFVENVARKTKAARAKGWSPGVDPVTLLPAESVQTSVFQEMAQETGWGSIVSVKHPSGDAEGFRTQVLGAGRLFFDVNAVGSMHTGSAHFLQWLMITPKLEAEFGPGAAQQLWKHMSTREGIGLWGWMLDRGPGFMRDFRSPRAFYEHQLVGENSWFGVR